MSVPALRLGVLALLAACAASGLQAQSKKVNISNQHTKTTTYRWVDEQGVVHYGDVVPPQYAAKDHEVINSEGVPVKHVDGAKNPDQLATEERDRAAMIRQKQHDSFLVTTYTSVKDIESLRDSRLEQLKTQRAAVQQFVESLRARLNTLQIRALTFRPYSNRPDARRMPDDVAEDLVHTVSEMRTQVTALANQGEEEAKLRDQFQADIERYRELHTLHSSN